MNRNRSLVLRVAFVLLLALLGLCLCRVSRVAKAELPADGPGFRGDGAATEADSDGDGLPDSWEDAHGLDAHVASQWDDPDLDDLTNMDEYNAGTDPYNSDTDGGGENDGSEVKLFEQDPLDPADDEIERMAWVQAMPRFAAVMLTYDVKAEYARLRLYRKAQRSLPYSLVDDDVHPTGWYLDGGLANAVAYHYCLMAVDGHGHRSAVTDPVSAIPGPQPIYLPLVWG